MTTLIEQLLAKMGLQDENNVLAKTTELVRLLELRSTNVPLQINEYGKIVLCADLAGAILGIAFDKEQALKLSGLRKTHYANNKRMFEKLLDLNKLVGVNDICIQLGLSEALKKANELLDFYKKVVVTENPDIDIAHPQYASMAVYFACKIIKKKVTKTKLMPFSNLRPTQWQQLEQRWEKFINKHCKHIIDGKSKPNSIEQKLMTTENTAQTIQSSNTSNKNVIEDYEMWKKRMLAQAERKLKELENEEQLEKENLILGM